MTRLCASFDAEGDVVGGLLQRLLVNGDGPGVVRDGPLRAVGELPGSSQVVLAPGQILLRMIVAGRSQIRATLGQRERLFESRDRSRGIGSQEEDTLLDVGDHLLTQQALIAGALSQQGLVELLRAQEVRLGGLGPSECDLEIGGLDGGPGRVAPDQGVGRIGLREDTVVEGQCGLGLGTMGLGEARAAGKLRGRRGRPVSL